MLLYVIWYIYGICCTLHAYTNLMWYNVYKIHTCMFPYSAIIEDGGSRDHVFGIVTPERTFHLTAPDANEKKYVS